MEKIARGLGYVWRWPLFDRTTPYLFKSSPNVAAGNAKFGDRDNAALANLTAKSVAFTAGSTRPFAYEQLTGATSAATCRVVGVIVTSGSWGAGTAAGFLFTEQDSGTFQAENVNGQVAGNACLHISAALSAAGLMVDLTTGYVAIPLTSAETTLPYKGVGDLRLNDAGGSGWADDAIRFENRDERDGLVFEGFIVSGSTGGGTLVGGDGLTRIQPGCVVVPEGIPGRQIAAGYNSGTGAFTVTTAFASTCDKKRCVVYAGAPADTASPVPATMVAETVVPVTPAALPVLGTTSLQGLVAWLALRAGLGKRTFTKAGLETQRNVADNATLGTATHADDGTTVTRNKLA